jgi:hypothetical protein
MFNRDVNVASACSAIEIAPSSTAKWKIIERPVGRSLRELEESWS